MWTRVSKLALLLTWLLTCIGCQMTSVPVLNDLTEPLKRPDQSPSKVQLLLEYGQLSEAELLLREAVERSPRSIGDRTNLGILLARTGQSDEAMTELNTVLKRRPAFCPALIQKAQLELDEYQIDAAERSYRTCLEAEPMHVVALLNLGILYEIYRGDLDQALHQYELYQQASVEPDRRVENWMVDVSRRLAAQHRLDEPLNQLAEVSR